MTTRNPSDIRPRPIPQGMTHATPCLIARDAAKALSFYERAFGAVETLRIDMPDGKLGHAELRIGSAELMLADEFPDMGYVGPQTLGGTCVSIHMYVEDVDAFAERAVAAGAKLLQPVADQFYGDRVAALEDPFGHRWSFATRVEEVSPEEMRRRASRPDAT